MKKLNLTEQVTLVDLQTQLESAGIDISIWGTGQAKTLEHLQTEIKCGESILIEDAHGNLLRHLVVGVADIYYYSPDGKTYRLKEDRQVFNDGRPRVRDLEQAISEKMKTDEDPTEAIIRGIREELGVEGEINLTELEGEEQVKMTDSYPGLRSHYVVHKFQATLEEGQFNPEGYVEEQPDKSTFFVWEEVG